MPSANNRWHLLWKIFMQEKKLIWSDKKNRCHWANPKNSVYVEYHDKEWGVPIYDDHKLYEMLLLESFQAGLSWECILNKRDAFKQAFANFNVKQISNFDENKIEELMQNEGIIRNRRKIQATINNAKIFLLIQKEFKSFSEYIWSWSSKKIIFENHLTSSPLSDAISKDLSKRGMKFVGTIIIYSYLQAVGIINSHENRCFLCRNKN